MSKLERRAAKKAMARANRADFLERRAKAKGAPRYPVGNSRIRPQTTGPIAYAARNPLKGLEIVNLAPKGDAPDLRAVRPQGWPA